MDKTPDPGTEAVLAYLANSLASAERAAFEKRLATDKALQAEFKAQYGLWDRLRSVPSEKPSRDLVPVVLARIRKEMAAVPAPAAAATPATVIRLPWLRPLAAAAALLLAIGAGLWLGNRQPLRPALPAAAPASGVAASEQTLQEACAWLAKTQQGDGSWDVASRGGKRQNAAGVTGLALMALLEGGPAFETQAQRAGEHLLALQEATGRFGPASSTAMYNHGIATTAVLKLYERSRKAEIREPLGRAVAYLLRAQTGRGGWGYLGLPGETPNTSVTAWQLQALHEAARLGWQDAKRFLASGAGYVDGLVRPDGGVGYGASPAEEGFALNAAGAFCLLAHPDAAVRARGSRLLAAAIAGKVENSQSDPYAAFFLSEASRAAGEKGNAAPAIESRRQAIAQAQVRSGPDLGSFPASIDPRGAAGGSVCTTALAALTLRRM